MKVDYVLDGRYEVDVTEAGIVAWCSIVVVRLPEHAQPIEDALPLGIDVLGWYVR
jgi:hypothetical protein